MHKVDAYALLAQELERWGRMSSPELVARVAVAATSRMVQMWGEEIEIAISVSWVDERRRAVRITAVAYGASHWRLERLEEFVVVWLDERPAQASVSDER